MTKRVAILGPESTGKSWLSHKLADHYNTNVVPEYAREFFEGKEYSYSIEDLLHISKCQINNENIIAGSSENIVLCDTELITISIWSQLVFNAVDDWIVENIKNHVYDLYLLCNLDIEWEYDPLRNNSHNRQYIYDLFVNELVVNKFNYRVVSGVGAKRLNNAITFVDEFLDNAKK